MHEYVKTEKKSCQGSVPVIQLRRSNYYRGGAEAEIQDCSLNFEFNSNISENHSLIPAIREAIKGMHPDKIDDKPLHGLHDNWALTLETYGSISPKGKNTYAFSAASELIIGGPSGLKISELPDIVQEAYSSLKKINNTQNIDFGENFSRQIIDKIKRDHDKRTDALQTILSLKPSTLINIPHDSNILPSDSFLTELDALTEIEQPTERKAAINKLLAQANEKQKSIRKNRSNKLSDLLTQISNINEKGNLRSAFNNETQKILSPLNQIISYLERQHAILNNISAKLEPQTTTNLDNLTLVTSQNSSFSKSLCKIADQPMMIQVTLGIPLSMFNTASKALAGNKPSADHPGILESAKYHYHSTSTNYPDITRSQLINKMKQYHLTLESNSLTGLLHIINAYRRGLNNTNPHKGPKHEMVLVNKNPLPNVIESLDEPEDFDTWITLCADLIADDFIQNGDKEVSWTKSSFMVSEWKNAIIKHKIDLIALYEKAYRHGQVGGLPKLNPASPYDPVAVYEFRDMPNLTLPELQSRFTQLAANINNFR